MLTSKIVTPPCCSSSRRTARALWYCVPDCVRGTIACPHSPACCRVWSNVRGLWAQLVHSKHLMCGAMTCPCGMITCTSSPRPFCFLRLLLFLALLCREFRIAHQCLRPTPPVCFFTTSDIVLPRRPGCRRTSQASRHCAPCTVACPNALCTTPCPHGPRQQEEPADVSSPPQV